MEFRNKKYPAKVEKLRQQQNKMLAKRTTHEDERVNKNQDLLKLDCAVFKAFYKRVTGEDFDYTECEFDGE